MVGAVVGLGDGGGVGASVVGLAEGSVGLDDQVGRDVDGDDVGVVTRAAGRGFTTTMICSKYA